MKSLEERLKDPATQLQLKWLANLKCDMTKSYTKGEAAAIIKKHASARHKNTKFARRSYYMRMLRPYFGVHSRKHMINITEQEWNCLQGISKNKKMLVPRKAHTVLVGNHSMTAMKALSCYRNIQRLIKEGYNIQTYIV